MGTIPAARLGLRVRLGLRQPDADGHVLGIAPDRLLVATDADLRQHQTLHVSLLEGAHTHLARGAVHQVASASAPDSAWAREAEIVLFSMPDDLGAWLVALAGQADRRAHPGLSDRARVARGGAWARSSAWTVDASAGGLRVTGAARPDVGADLQLLLYATADQDPMRLSGRVAHLGGGAASDDHPESCFGLALGDLDPRERAAWGLYLERLAAFAPADLDRLV